MPTRRALMITHIMTTGWATCGFSVVSAPSLVIDLKASAADYDVRGALVASVADADYGAETHSLAGRP